MQTIKFEAKKDGLRQNQDGSFKVVLNVHPQDDIAHLINSPMGQTFMCVLVATDGGDPVTIETGKPKRSWNELSASQRAGILSSSEKFQKWVGEEPAADYLRRMCGVQSRKDLNSNVTAWGKFNGVLAQFLNETQANTEAL